MTPVAQRDGARPSRYLSRGGRPGDVLTGPLPAEIRCDGTTARVGQEVDGVGGSQVECRRKHRIVSGGVVVVVQPNPVIGRNEATVVERIRERFRDGRDAESYQGAGQRQGRMIPPPAIEEVRVRADGLTHEDRIDFTLEHGAVTNYGAIPHTPGFERLYFVTDRMETLEVFTDPA